MHITDDNDKDYPYMPTISQIRAARALLDWSQSDLADNAGLSQTGIARIENGTNKPNSRTLEKIRTAFDNADIDFIDDSGVKKRTGEIKILKGPEGLRQFFNELYQTAADLGGELCLFNGTPARLTDWLGEDWYDMHNKRMEKLAGKFEYKIIVKEGETHFPASNYAEYRFFPEELFNEKTIYILGNKVFFRDKSDDQISMIRIEQADLAKSMQILFNVAWEHVAKTS